MQLGILNGESAQSPVIDDTQLAAADTRTAGDETASRGGARTPDTIEPAATAIAAAAETPALTSEADVVAAEQQAIADAAAKAEADRKAAEEKAAADKAQAEKAAADAKAAAEKKAEEARKAAETKKSERAEQPAASRSEPGRTESGDSNFLRLAKCESGYTPGANPVVNSGNGFYGVFQFNLQTWRGNGGTGSPNDHTYAEQEAVAKRLQASRGWSPWPACSKKLGLR